MHFIIIIIIIIIIINIVIIIIIIIISLFSIDNLQSRNIYIVKKAQYWLI